MNVEAARSAVAVARGVVLGAAVIAALAIIPGGVFVLVSIVAGILFGWCARPLRKDEAQMPREASRQPLRKLLSAGDRCQEAVDAWLKAGCPPGDPVVVGLKLLPLRGPRESPENG